MLIPTFCGVISAHARTEREKEDVRYSFTAQRHELGDYCLYLQGNCPGASMGDYGVLLNGRIFNTAELAEELNEDLLDQSHLLLHAYRKWGIDFPKHLQGEFALVLWDRAAARVLLVSGPGSPSLPLFYSQRSGDLFFARGLRQLLAKMDVTPRINEDYLARWLALVFIGSDSTFYSNVFSVFPGSLLLFECGRITQDVYWQPEKTPALHLRDSREYADGLREMLVRAIRDGLAGHAVVGSLLSGGLDSSTMTSLAAEMLQHQHRRLQAFTAVPAHPVNDVAGRFCDEGPAAMSVAKMWPNVDHVLVRSGHHSIFKMMDLFGAEQMEPIINPANFDWAYEISLRARQRHLDILLVGDSGNVSSSYNGTFALRTLASEGRWRVLLKLARELRHKGTHRWLGIANEVLGSWIPLELRCRLNVARRRDSGMFGYSMIRHEFARHHDLGAIAIERNMQRLDLRSLRVFFLRRPDVGNINDAFRALTGVSRADPAGDRRVIEYCLSVPIEYYCEQGVSRSLIRNAMIGRLPEQVRTEHRRGLQAADFTIHFQREREEALAELSLMKKVDLAMRALNIEEMERMIQCSSAQIEACGGMMNFWPKLLRAFSVGRFLRRFEDGTLFSSFSSEREEVGQNISI